MILTPEELELLTAKTERAQKRYGSQAVELKHLGIPYLTRSDGTLIVFKRHLENGPTEKKSEASPALCL
jgi:hypothetical protein